MDLYLAYQKAAAANEAGQTIYQQLSDSELMSPRAMERLSGLCRLLREAENAAHTAWLESLPGSTLPEPAADARYGVSGSVELIGDLYRRESGFTTTATA